MQEPLGFTHKALDCLILRSSAPFFQFICPAIHPQELFCAFQTVGIRALWTTKVLGRYNEVNGRISQEPARVAD